MQPAQLDLAHFRDLECHRSHLAQMAQLPAALMVDLLAAPSLHLQELQQKQVLVVRPRVWCLQ